MSSTKMIANNIIQTIRGGGRITAAVFMVLVAAAGTSVSAQTFDDGIMLSKLKYCTGVFYSYDYWDHYWEGSTNRVNANIGTITTRSVQYIGNYGVTDHLDLLVNVPYVYTSASKGVLHGQSGFQDVTFGAKYKVISVPVREIGAIRAFAVLAGAIPITNYTPDDAPLSVGTHSKRISGRTTLNYLGRNGLYLNGSTSYTLRGNVTLDRASYYTNDKLYFSNQVAMPNQFDYIVSAGYRKNDATLTAAFSQQQSRGGGDIRRQDVPFVSNRVNFSRISATLTYPLPRVNDMQYWFLYSNIFDGRNVGQANNFTMGFLYTFDFNKRAITR
jgi:hypothetical protein